MRTKWSRNEKLGLLGVLAALLSLIAAALVVPEVRELLDLDGVLSHRGQDLPTQQSAHTGAEEHQEATASNPRKAAESQDLGGDGPFDGFDFAFQGCASEGAQIKCTLWVANTQSEDRGLYFIGGKTVDDRGVDHLAEEITFGNDSDYQRYARSRIYKTIPSRTRLRAVATFIGWRVRARALALLRFSFQTEEGAEIKLDFRDIPLGK